MLKMHKNVNKCKYHHKNFSKFFNCFKAAFSCFKTSHFQNHAMPLPPHISDCSDTKYWLHSSSLHKMGWILLFLEILITSGEHLFICYMEGGGLHPTMVAVTGTILG